MESSGIRREVSFCPTVRGSVILLLVTAGVAAAQGPSPNWGGGYSPCDRHPDLLSHEHMDLGVRLSTTNTALARQFGRAMKFWAGVIDVDWREVDSRDCSVQLVEGAKDLFDTPGVAARAQYPDRPEFQGWVAFNPASRLTEREMFVVSVHEIGHLLGLPHNPSASSVMYFLNLDDSVWLDAADLHSLAERHKLRAGVVANGRVTPTRQVAQ